MKKNISYFIAYMFIAVLLVSCTGGTSSNSSSGNSSSGNCEVPSDRASDGSRCGDRAASERPGGN